MTSRSRLAAPIALALALLVAPTLSGCFGNPIESIIEGATGGDVDLGGTSLPEGYPASEVPIIAGEILYGGSIGNADGRIYNVTVRVSGGDALDQIRSQLESAGFTAGVDAGDSTGGGTYIGSTDAWGVVVIVAQDGDGWTANYTVTSASAQ